MFMNIKTNIYKYANQKRLIQIYIFKYQNVYISFWFPNSVL